MRCLHALNETTTKITIIYVIFQASILDQEFLLKEWEIANAVPRP
jgi:hypothetical protein